MRTPALAIVAGLALALEQPHGAHDQQLDAGVTRAGSSD